MADTAPDTAPDADRSAGQAPDTTTDWQPVADIARATGLGERALRRWAGRGWVRTRTARGPTGERTELAVADVLARSRRPGAGQAPDAPDSAGLLPIPVDEWRRVLAQLGNLHEAGQVIATEREGRARAEEREAFRRQQAEEARQQAAEEQVRREEEQVRREEEQVRREAAERQLAETRARLATAERQLAERPARRRR